MGGTASKESKTDSTQTVDELVKEWKANPDIKELESFMQKIIEHMKYSYKELTGSEHPSVDNKDFCRKFQIYVKSEIISYIDRSALTAYFRPF